MRAPVSIDGKSLDVDRFSYTSRGSGHEGHDDPPKIEYVDTT